MADNNTDYDETVVNNDKEPATKHDVTEGGVLGAVGGAVVGALAGGPVGAVIGFIAGGAASAAAVDVVDKHDHDYARTVDHTTDNAVTTPAYDTTTTPAYDANAATLRGRPAGDDIVVPVVEEELAVGKREVQSGGARVHTNVIETPVEREVTLRDETVTVDRRPVDRAITDADRPFQEGVVEFEEMDEVPVVTKEARVVEEVVVGKVASERTETVRDTVRRTDVEVEQVPTGGATRDDRSF